MNNLPEPIQVSINAYRNEQKLYLAVARNIKEARLRAGLTQLQLAELLRRKQPQIARWERSSYRRHTLHSLNIIATALGVSVTDLVAPDSKASTDTANPPKEHP